MKLKPEERCQFLEEFVQSAYCPAVMTCVKVVDRPSESGIYPPDLTKLFQENHRQERLDVLQNAGLCVNLALTPAQADALEAATRSQSGSSLWYWYRSGSPTSRTFVGLRHWNPQ